MKIHDGKGRGFSMSVSEDNRGNMSAKIGPRIFYVSRDFGQAFSITSVAANAVAGDLALYIKNTSSTKRLFIRCIDVSAANAALWKLWEVTGDTPTGTAIVSKNLNLNSGRTADALCYGNGAVGGLTTVAGQPIKHIRSIAGGSEQYCADYALILGSNSAVALEYDTGTTGPAEISVDFHFEDIGRAN